MTLTRNDLIRECEACHGEGWLYDPPRDSNKGGRGTRRVAFQRKESCAACRMTGQILTEAGEAIADVVLLIRAQSRI